MDTEKLKLLKKFLGGSYRSGNEHLFYCPKCKHHKKKMSINLELNAFKCWICDYSSKGIHRLVRRFADFTTRKEWEKIDNIVDLSKLDSLDSLFAVEEEEIFNEEIEMPNSFRTLTGNQKKLTSGPAKKYLRERNISKEDVLNWKIGYCDAGDFAGRIIVPSFNDKGELNYYIARSYDGNWMKYKNPKISKDIIFNDLNIDWGDNIILTEGVFDKGILKAVFMAGGPGSGKSYVAGELFGIPKKINLSISGLKTVNSDTEFEFLLKKYTIF